jgi:acetyl-CoA carboxylase carboxyltransferase component
MGEAGARKILKDYNMDSSVVNTARLGHIDAVIEPSSTRSRLIRDLEALVPHYSRPKLHKKQGNIPL